MITKNIFKIFAACFICCGLSAVFTSCSSNEDPFFSASEDDYPRIINTDMPEGKGGVPASLPSIERTTNFTCEVIVTPVHYTTVTWFIDDEQVGEGLSINVPLLAGDHLVKVVATTTKGQSTYRLLTVNVRPAAGDPELANDDRSRWLTIGTTKTIECKNVTNVTKVFVGKQEASNVSFADGKLTFNVPSMTEGEYMVSIEADGMRYGCGVFTVSNDEYVDPGIKETVLWEGDKDINWGDVNVEISASDLANIPVGAKIRLVYQLIDADYHAMRITTPWWGDNPEDQIIPQFDLTEETPNPFEFTYTEANKTIVDERGGMLIVGFGYKLTKVIAVEEVAPAETTLLEGNFVIDWDAAICHLDADVMATIPVGSVIKIYYEVPEAEYHNLRIVTNWWNDVPGGAQIDVTDDTPNPYTLNYTEDFKNLVTGEEGMSCVGFGYNVTKITYE